MQTRGAVIRSAPGIYEVADFELDDPQPGEQPVDNPSTWDAPTRAGRALSRRPLCSPAAANSAAASSSSCSRRCWADTR
jgi:hypothetical protein